MRLGTSLWIPAPRLRGDKLRGNDIFNAHAVVPRKREGMSARRRPEPPQPSFPRKRESTILDNRSLALRLTP